MGFSIEKYVVSPTGVRVPACVDLETWIRDYATYVKTNTFDCELALDTFTLDVLLPDAEGFCDGACEFGDVIFLAAADLGLTDEWDGPFAFYIADWEAYDRYIAARVKSEYGVQVRD